MRPRDKKTSFLQILGAIEVNEEGWRAFFARSLRARAVFNSMGCVWDIPIVPAAYVPYGDPCAVPKSRLSS
jgi:hypothetical protein